MADGSRLEGEHNVYGETSSMTRKRASKERKQRRQRALEPLPIRHEPLIINVRLKVLEPLIIPPLNHLQRVLIPSNPQRVQGGFIELEGRGVLAGVGVGIGWVRGGVFEMGCIDDDLICFAG